VADPAGCLVALAVLVTGRAAARRRG
jgi:hypothetical protein